MLSALADVILPVVLVAACGALLARVFTLDQVTLTKVQLYCLTPALAFRSLVQMNLSATSTARLAVAFFAVTAIAGLAALGVAWWLGPGARRPVIAGVLIGNHGNFGLPIALLALGQPGLDVAVLLFLFSLMVMWTVGPAVLGGHTRPAAMLRAIGVLPVTWALLAALGLRQVNAEVPSGIFTAIDLVADAAIPLVLLSLGIQLSSAGRVRFTTPVLVTVLLRVAVLPLVAYLVSLALGLTGLLLQSVVLAFAMPTAVNTLMLTMEYGGDADTVASIVAVSTLASLLTISVVVTALPHIG